MRWSLTFELELVVFSGPVSNFEIVGPTGPRQKLIVEASYIANVMEQACIYLQKTLCTMLLLVCKHFW